MSDPIIEPVDTQPVDTQPVDFGPPMPVPVAKKSSRGGTVILLAAAFVAVAGLAFAGGRFTAPAAAAAGSNGQGQTGFRGPRGSFTPGGAGGFTGGGGGGRVFGAGGVTLRGQVTAITADSITLQLDNGSSITLPLNSSTTYHQATASTAGTVKVGDKVSVEPGAPSFNPAASPAAGATPPPSGGGGFGGNIDFGPAVDVTVIAN